MAARVLTESEWVESASVYPLFRCLGYQFPGAMTDRKLRLLCCAAARQCFDWVGGSAIEAVRVSERYAGGHATEEQMCAARNAVRATGTDFTPPNPIGVADYLTHLFENGCAFAASPPGTRNYALLCLKTLADTNAHAALGTIHNFDAGWHEHLRTERAAQAVLLRDIFGNPFHSVIFNPAWRTSDVMSLAKGADEERAFDRLPILADALQDAGCDSDPLLGHLRDEAAPHVRGCWALDMVLGKS